MNLKNIEDHVTYPAVVAGKVKTILSAQLPTFQLGRFANFISEYKHGQLVNDTLRMDAVPGAALVSSLTYDYICRQIKQRPRIKLIAATKLILTILMMLTTLGVDKLQAKKSDIRINGRAILVAQDYEPNDSETQLDASISYKENPLDYKMPVKGYVSQGYRGYHRAIDIATGRTGMPIVALGEGIVEYAGFMADGKGNVVIVNHGDGLKSLYAHMGKIRVAVGNQVDSETALGVVGMTGRTTGAHVHLEIYDNDIAVDPEKVLPDVDNPLNIAPKAEIADYTQEG